MIKKRSISVIVMALCMVCTSYGQSVFNLGTYNLRYKNTNDKENQWKFRIDHIKSLITYYEFDIFGTQEGLKEQLEDLSKLPNYAYFGLGRDDGKDGGEHSAIFYRMDKFKLIDSGNFWLSETPNQVSIGWDAACKRICTWGLFEDTSTHIQFYVFNLHLDHKGDIARKESTTLVLSKIKEITKDKYPLFLCGDFNMLPEHSSIKTIKEEMKDSRDISLTPPYGPVGTANGFDLNRKLIDRIDYIFIRGNIQILKYAALSDIQDSRFPSDHLPVVVKVRVEK